MINVMKGTPDNVIGFDASGKISEQDYDEVVIPNIEKHMETHDEARVVYHINSDFDGFSAKALWEDTKLGFKNIENWQKIALVTDRDWLENAARLLNFTIPAKVRVFEESELNQAIKWAGE
ncbi:MAG: STAS/SEC14 domain-containing protein [Gammaproteobacteria bacterium]|nr:STAS/SEC14 domain-containing protein [Gammaproteobacteria bacterium]